ncbi:hypothetical protein ACFL4G_11360 [Thermodesulfobacteriota bacterium]
MKKFKFHKDPDHLTCNVVRIFLKYGDYDLVGSLVKFIREEVEEAYESGVEEGVKRLD